MTEVETHLNAMTNFIGSIVAARCRTVLLYTLHRSQINEGLRRRTRALHVLATERSSRLPAPEFYEPAPEGLSKFCQRKRQHASESMCAVETGPPPPLTGLQRTGQDGTLSK
jgi:hypothetical protein